MSSEYGNFVFELPLTKIMKLQIELEVQNPRKVNHQENARHILSLLTAISTLLLLLPLNNFTNSDPLKLHVLSSISCLNKV